MPADTITTGLTFLFNTLHGDATLMGYLTGVFQDIAPETTSGPQAPDYCIIGVSSPGLDTLTANAKRILTRTLYLVKIVGPTADMANISAAYQRADALLALVRNPTGLQACYREAPFYLPEPKLINGEPWVNLGGLYRIEM